MKKLSGRSTRVATRLEQLQEFLKSKPDDPFLKYAIGIELKNAGEIAQARDSFELIMQKHPEYVPTYYHLGQTLEQLGMNDEALLVYEKGISVAGKAGDAHAVQELQRAYSSAKDLL